MMRKSTWTFPMLALAACHMAARTPEAPTGDTKAIRFGTLVTENGAPVRDAVVVIRGDKVVSVGSGDSAVPRGASVTDLRAFTGIPGLVEIGRAHV